MLLTETNTPDVEERVMRAFAARFGLDVDTFSGNAAEHDAFFEHGQWWVAHIATGRTWSVVDACPGTDGLDFEEL